MNSISHIEQELLSLQDKKHAAFTEIFFKVKPADNAGHQFLGIRVPQLRKLAKKHQTINLKQISSLLKADYNEMRSLGLYILIMQYEKADMSNKQTLYDFYVTHMPHINNWNLVDASAPYLVGHYLIDKDTHILTKWAQSENLWIRRIAIVSTLYFIRQNKHASTLSIAKQLLCDKQDLIHKAVGWMLREVGKKDSDTLKQFIKQYYSAIPRTTLRYAIERFSPQERKNYLKGICI